VSGQTVQSARLNIDSGIVTSMAGEWGVGQRALARISGDALRLSYIDRVEVTRGARPLGTVSAVPMHDLTPELITFLRPSQYCQSDQLGPDAAAPFGLLTGGARIEAILDWMATEMTYDPFYTTPQTTVLETWSTRRGVCRDYAHLFCGLARASGIPARYVAVYGAPVDPPDFHAVVEVWLEDGWHLLDPTAMCSPDRLAVIGVGRDAADVPFMETPDDAWLMDQSVRVTEA